MEDIKMQEDSDKEQASQHSASSGKKEFDHEA